MSAVLSENLAALRTGNLFTGLSTRQLEFLAARMDRQDFRANDVIFHKGDIGLALYVIVKGLVKITMQSDTDQEAVLDLLPVGELFGELALIDGLPRSASAVAMEDTETLILGRDDFLEFLQDRPGAAIAILSVVSRRLRRANGLIADAMFRSVPTRIAKKLLELASEFGRKTDCGIAIDLRLRQVDMASMVGAARESVNRCLMGLEERGLIKMEKQRITILRPDELRDSVS